MRRGTGRAIRSTLTRRREADSQLHAASRDGVLDRDKKLTKTNLATAYGADPRKTRVYLEKSIRSDDVPRATSPALYLNGLM